MATRPAATILLLTRHMIARADFARDQSLQRLWSQGRPDVQDWPALVEIALALGPKPGGRTYVLCSDLWTQTLALPNIAKMGMPADELAAALNFEAEALSGQSAFESSVAAHALPAGNSYWIVQPRTADLAHADQMIHHAGSRLAGLGHPGGLPFCLNTAEKPASWARIEFWPDAVLLLRGDALGKTLVQVVNADPQTGRWKAAWEAWRQEAGGVQWQEALIGPGVVATAPNLANTTTLDREAALTSWLSSWAKQLDGKTVAVPMLRPPKKPMSAGVRYAISVGLAVAVLLCCGSVHYALDSAVKRDGAELKRFQDQGKKLADLQKQVEDHKTKQKELEKEKDHLEKTMKVLAMHRQRLARFMTTLKELYPEHLYVEKIEVESGEPRLRGHCMQPELADQFANKIAAALLEQGWEVQTSDKAALKRAANGAPWSFDIQLKSAKEMTIDTQHRVEAKKGKR
jgi:hypothetical protein